MKFRDLVKRKNDYIGGLLLTSFKDPPTITEITDLRIKKVEKETYFEVIGIDFVCCVNIKECNFTIHNKETIHIHGKGCNYTILIKKED